MLVFGSPTEDGDDMAKRKRHSAEEVIGKLRKVEAAMGAGKSVADAVREVGVSEQTYYRWRRKYANMGKAEAKRLRELEKENARLKKLLAEATLDNDMLKELLKGNF